MGENDIVLKEFNDFRGQHSVAVRLSVSRYLHNALNLIGRSQKSEISVIDNKLVVAEIRRHQIDEILNATAFVDLVLQLLLQCIVFEKNSVNLI